MAKKTESKTGHTFNIQGEIHAGRDVIQGDVSNYYSQYLAQINTPPELAEKLLELAAEVATLKQQPRIAASEALVIEATETGLKEAAEQTVQPVPLGARVVGTLEKVKKTLEVLSGSLAAATDLGMKIGALILLASKIFGG
jgi:hypothetical protein